MGSGHGLNHPIRAPTHRPWGNLRQNPALSRFASAKSRSPGWRNRGSELPTLGELIWDHCKQLEHDPSVHHEYGAHNERTLADRHYQTPRSGPRCCCLQCRPLAIGRYRRSPLRYWGVTRGARLCHIGSRRLEPHRNVPVILASSPNSSLMWRPARQRRQTRKFSRVRTRLRSRSAGSEAKREAWRARSAYRRSGARKSPARQLSHAGKGMTAEIAIMNRSARRTGRR